MNQEARKGQNEVWFRELNERLEDRATTANVAADGFEIVCECAREECTERIAISVVDYEAVRAKPTHFILAHGHQDPDCETIFSSTVAYNVVEKTGEAALIAKNEDPRAGNE